jgi:ABC-2 type transport system permease protein
MFTLFRKEINGFLNSLIGYIVIIVFLLVIGLFLWVLPVDSNILDFGYASMDGLFVIAPFVFLFLIPAITMRSFADEKRTGTIELLMTQPLTDLQVILAKYFAGLILVIFSLIPTLVYFFSVYRLGLTPGNLDIGSMWGSYIGLVFLSAAFVSIGIFASSVSDNQIVSFIIAVFLSAFFYMGFELIYIFIVSGNIGLKVQSIGINVHYSSISCGVIDSRDLIYFISISIFFLLITKLSLESRKW